MTDPVSIGALVASALAIAGPEGLKTFASEAVKDAYSALKSRVSDWFRDDVEALEKSPASAGRRLIIAEAVDGLADPDKAQVVELAQRLVAALKTQTPVGLDIGELEALSVKLGEVSVESGVGVRIGKAKIAGAFETGAITVGSDPLKKN